MSSIQTCYFRFTTFLQNALTAEKEELQLKLAADLAEQLAKQEQQLKEQLEAEINNVRGEKRKVIVPSKN